MATVGRAEATALLAAHSRRRRVVRDAAVSGLTHAVLLAGTFVMLLPFVWMLRSHAPLQAKLLPVCSALIALAGGYWLIERTLLRLSH